MKRVADFILALFSLVLFSPLIALCAFAIRREDGLPVIYRQERIGRYGNPFQIYKFRTMKNDAEDGGIPQLVERPNDPRLTKIGAMLRKHHLDELPQLWNVLKGDMAFVGPRPERRYYIDKISQYDARYSELYQLRPGVTSYATLKNGYADTMEKMLCRLNFDLHYLHHHSLWMDCKILFTTFTNIISGKVF